MTTVAPPIAVAIWITLPTGSEVRRTRSVLRREHSVELIDIEDALQSARDVAEVAAQEALADGTADISYELDDNDEE